MTDGRSTAFDADRRWLLLLAEQFERRNRLKQIQDHLIKKLYTYSGSDQINDDYTTMIVKFNGQSIQVGDQADIKQTLTNQNR